MRQVLAVSGYVVALTSLTIVGGFRSSVMAASSKDSAATTRPFAITEGSAVATVKIKKHGLASVQRVDITTIWPQGGEFWTNAGYAKLLEVPPGEYVLDLLLGANPWLNSTPSQGRIKVVLEAGHRYALDAKFKKDFTSTSRQGGTIRFTTFGNWEPILKDETVGKNVAFAADSAPDLNPTTLSTDEPESDDAEVRLWMGTYHRPDCEEVPEFGGYPKKLQDVRKDNSACRRCRPDIRPRSAPTASSE